MRVLRACMKSLEEATVGSPGREPWAILLRPWGAKLKALLALHEIKAPPMRKFPRQIQLTTPIEREFGTFIDASEILTAHGVQSRYR